MGSRQRKHTHTQKQCGCINASAAALPPPLLQGSVVIRQRVTVEKQTPDGRIKLKERLQPVVLHCDIIKDDFWQQHPELLA